MGGYQTASRKCQMRFARKQGFANFLLNFRARKHQKESSVETEHCFPTEALLLDNKEYLELG